MHSWQQTLWESQYIVIPVSDHLILQKYSDDYEPVTEVRKDDHCARTILVDNLPSNVTINQVLDCLIINRSEIETTQGTKPKLSYYFWLDKENNQITCQITFKTATSAQNLIKNNVDVELDGRKLLLKKKNPPRKKVFPWSTSGDAGVDSSKEDYRDRTILVNNLPADTNISQILKCLGITNDVETGPNHKLRIMLWKNEKNDKKTCQITFKTAQAAQNCIKNKTSVELNGNRLLLTGMKPLKSREDNFTVDSLSVHIAGLPKDVSTADIFDAFSTHVGGISMGEDGQPNVFILSRRADQSFGKVTFNSEELARKCVELSGIQFAEGDKNVVQITLFKTKTKAHVAGLY